MIAAAEKNVTTPFKANTQRTHNKVMTNAGVAIAVVLLFAGATIGSAAAKFETDPAGRNESTDVVIRQDGLAAMQAELAKRITTAPAKRMQASGLAGAIGGAHVRVTVGAAQEILLPIPQLADGQVPLCYFLSTTPPDAAAELRLQKRDDGNWVVRIRLADKIQDIQIAWSAVVLLSAQDVTQDRSAPEPFRTATACVQAKSEAISKLAADTWPQSGKASDFAAGIQRYIQDMKRLDRPRSLDALGILKCGENSICTANANLAAALMRAKGIACRSIAVIPPMGQRLEMHRIVEFFDNGRWRTFDPSSLHRDIPTKPWQNIILGKTTIADEEAAMKPRMASMLGCPYGQEIELLTGGVTLSGQDFFWTLATPLAEFDVTDAVARLAVQRWNRYLTTGVLTSGQVQGCSAKSSAELMQLLRSE